MWMYGIQVVYTMISVKPVLLLVCMVMTVIFLPWRWEQLLGVGGDCLICGLGFRLDGPGFASRCRKEIFFLCLDRLWDLLSVFLTGYRQFFSLGQRRPEFYHSVICGTQVKNEWNCTSTPLYVFMVWTGTTLPLLALLHVTQTILYIFQFSNYLTSCKGKSWTLARATRRLRFMHPWSQIWPSVYKITVRCSRVPGKGNGAT